MGTPGYRVLGEFVGEFDVATGRAELRMVDSFDKSMAIPDQDASHRNNEEETAVEGRIRFLQDSDGNGQTPALCRNFWTSGWSDHGDSWRFWVPSDVQEDFLTDLDGDVGENRFCTNFRLINDVGRDLAEMWIIVDGVTIPGVRARMEDAPRVVPSQLDGDPDQMLEPNSLQGMFRYGSFLEDEEVIGQWYFYFGGAAVADFRVRGRIVEIFREQCWTGTDDNGDGLEDSGCGTFRPGDDCSMNQDCLSGECDGGVPIDPTSPSGGQLGLWQPSAEDDGCFDDSDCVPGLVCSGGDFGAQQVGTCGEDTTLPIGSSCTADGECSSGYCDAEVDECRIPLGGPCVLDDDCDSSLECEDNICSVPPLLGLGEECVEDGECGSGYCDAWVDECRIAPGGMCLVSDFCAFAHECTGTCEPGPAFVSTWNTANVSVGSSDNRTVVLPLDSNGTYDFLVDWGDDSQDRITSHTQSQVTHVYATGGTYEITIRGQIEGWRFNDTGDRLKLLAISSWGPLRLGNETGYFHGAENLTVSATDNLDLTGTTNLTQMFRGCTSLTTIPSIDAWDMSGVTNLQFMFFGADSFNQDLNGWNVSNVTNFGNMFSGATAFNGDISSWQPTSVTNMGNMFNGASSFNRDIGSWPTPALQNTVAMFNDASSFNQDLNGWNVSGVLLMQSMFAGATVFNGDISGWQPSSVTNMRGMFNGAHAFNRDIGSWDVGEVTDMSEMFWNARAFNQDIGSWDVGEVTNMESMFNGTWAFDQDIGSWDVTNVANMSFMFGGITAFSTANYDNLLIGWASQAPLQANVTFHAGNSRQYTSAAAAARATLTDTWTWTIHDDGQAAGTLGQPCSTGGDCFAGQWCPTQDQDPHCAPAIELAPGADMYFQFIPSGGANFTIGAPPTEPGYQTNEQQASISFTRSIFLQSTPVTVGQWQEVVSLIDPSLGLNPAFGPNTATCDTHDCPVERVNWYEAVIFANFLSTLEGLEECYTATGCTSGGSAEFGEGCDGTTTSCTDNTFVCDTVTFAGLDCEGYRLPTEYEWEFAVRAGTTGATYAGTASELDCTNSLPLLNPIAWYHCNSETGVFPYFRETQAVAQKQANNWGLFDMLGNVAEWTDTWYGSAHVPATDPLGPADGFYRTARGGSFSDAAGFIRSARRYGMPPEQRIRTHGFRLARTFSE